MYSAETRKKMKELAYDVRIGCMEQFGALGVGHVGGSLSVCDLMACLYGGVMNIDPANPRFPFRDRFIMSKGHAGPAMYSALALSGFFPKEELLTLNQPGTNLPSHTDRTKTPGVDMTTGSLGQGFSSALGIALGCKMKGLENYTYILLGDGESEEGQVWECAMFAPAKKLGNVIAFIDYNNRQIDGNLQTVIGLEDYAGKFAAFGWHAIDVEDGNDVDQICDAIEAAQKDPRPSMIVLHTLKAKGWPYAENLENNHNINVTPEQAQACIADLKAAKEQFLKEAE